MVLASKRFLDIFHTLSPEAQADIVETYLSPLLDEVSPSTQTSVLSRLEAHRSTVSLSLKANQRQLDSLVSSLIRDAKCAFTSSRSQFDEILYELVGYIADWLLKIWRVIYEQRKCFEEAHRCLIAIETVLNKVTELSGGNRCRCNPMIYPITLDMKPTYGCAVKSFRFSNPQCIEEALIWIWRELFVCFSMTSSNCERSIPTMLEDIEDRMGWIALEQILYGGKPAYLGNDDDDDEWEDEDDDPSESDEPDERPECLHYAAHWTPSIRDQYHPVTKIIQNHLRTIFSQDPTPLLYNAIISMSTNPSTSKMLLQDLAQIATTSADTLSAALEIHAGNGNAFAIQSLLQSSSYLLQPHHAPSLQLSVIVLGTEATLLPNALHILERELISTIRSIHHAVLRSYSQADEKANKDELLKLLKLPAGSSRRAEKVETWLENASTPTSPAQGMAGFQPAAFAAMLMGLAPPTPDVDDDADLVSYIDMEPHDPDYEELRREFRPQFKLYFEGWKTTADSLQGGQAILAKIYREMTELMMYMRAPDIVQEMIARLHERPSRVHIGDALATLSTFCKQQRKKQLLQNEKRRRLNKEKGTGFTPRQASRPMPLPPTLGGGIDDVD